MTFLDVDLKENIHQSALSLPGIRVQRVGFGVVEGIVQVDGNGGLAIQYVRRRRR